MGRDDPIGDIVAALAREPLYVGLAVGVVCAALVLLAHRRHRAVGPLVVDRGGLVVAVAGLAALHGPAWLWPLLVAGVAALAGAGLAREVGARIRTVAVLVEVGVLALAIEVGLARGLVPGLVVGAVALAGGGLLVSFDAGSAHRRHGALLLLLTAGGLFGVLPNTEPALALVGVVAVITAVGYLVRGAGGARGAALGHAGALACAGLVAWAIGAGSAGQPRALVGGVACLGLLALEPLVRWPPLRGASLLDRLGRRPWVVAALVALHAVLVYGASRVAGMRATGPEAAATAAVLFAPALVLLAVAAWGAARLRGRAG